ncbi:hypothetical protein TH66_00810 [Carbonactinospora thermoautotrophica]|uniref:DUF6879 domain-containing protein n=1 Tax=Carbonactinospora thermoautotrophica TaxID=1469144 RepID=A0A132N7E5_9ACTN|nr:DUF6879 family protein [Carbonactinospora thermoautotrophica]KWX03188.1 hypothetical protein LI90_4239 [Carbonactinospora thermoautotrophica]KWX03263.1 hypothetical protein LI90_4314 [Carbonactinospora thermoautotrophica]KWX05897.1 hypothetical protein TH66_00810 [Carbonactinospora thermoautotrophica]KWX09214.1 hypothetical protein TR74_10950 [Carbonactinospora thermoautotrophica]
MDLLTGDDFTDLFRTFEHTAFRLETRAAYGIPEEDEPFQRFLRGEEPPSDWLRPWLDLITEQTRQGKRVERVRLIDEPPSDYLRFEVWSTPLNLQAGEDIRYLPRRRALELQLPKYDYWLFDSRRLAMMHFDHAGRFQGAEIVEDPRTVVQHAYWRDTAWHYATPYQAFVES